MDISVINSPVEVLSQLGVIVPTIENKFRFRYPNTVIVPNSITLSPAEIVLIENYVFDLCVACPGYDPVQINKDVVDFDAMSAMLTIMIGSPPTGVSDYNFISARNGLDSSGNVKILATWWIEPQLYADFKLAPCYVP